MEQIEDKEDIDTLEISPVDSSLPGYLTLESPTLGVSPQPRLSWGTINSSPDLGFLQPHTLVSTVQCAYAKQVLLGTP